MRLVRGLVVLALFCALGGALKAQQAGSGSLSGTVSDPSGAVVPGAEITVRRIATGLARKATTDEQGFYRISNLAPGDYEIKVTKEGFRESTVPVFHLLAGQSANLNQTLAVAGTKGQTIVLDEEGLNVLVDTASPVVSGVITSATMESLPLNGRNFLELAFLVPGNAPAANFDPTKTNSVVVSSAGQMGRGGNVTLDGADDNDDVVGGPLLNLPQDAVQEFQIATNQFSAESGRSGSSVINVVTRGGTNNLHGSLSAYFRDDALQALPATADRAAGTPPFGRQQMAGTLGGPIQKDKAWLFGAFEYRNQDGAVLVGRRNLATRTIDRSFAAAPLNDLLFTTRADWHPADRDALTFRYSLERAEDTTSSTLIRAIGSASQRQDSQNHYQTFLAGWQRAITPRLLSNFRFSVNNFINRTNPVTLGPQLTFPSIQDGASFRVPQQTRMNRLQFSEGIEWTHGRHALSFGGEIQRIDSDFDLGVFRQGRIELVEDFAPIDRDGDGQITDNDLLFAVTLRSGRPGQDLVIPDADNTHLAFYAQDTWRLNPNFVLSLGLRYELDSDVKNVSRTSQLNPLIFPFLKGTRTRDKDNFAPRVGFNWSTPGGSFSINGGYGIFYDRITLEVQSLERGLDGRALPIEVRAGNVFFLTPTGTFAPGAPTLANPFTGFIIPGAGAAGINIIDNQMENPSVQQFSLGIQWEFLPNTVLRANGLYDHGTKFIIGRNIGTVFNPVVGGPDSVKNLESSAFTKYSGLLVNVERRMSHNFQFSASYTFSKSMNYANDDQIPFANGPLDPTKLRLEYGPSPMDQRHRFVLSGIARLPYGFQLAPIWTMASDVPMDILLPDGSSRIPGLQRNAGGRVIQTGAELNTFIQRVNAAGGIGGTPLPLVDNAAQFSDSFLSFDLRLSKAFRFREKYTLEGIAEVFNLFNVTNILGVSNTNYSGFANTLVRDDNNPANPGFLRSSSFGRPVTTAGGVFGSGGPRAFQFGARFSF